MQTNIAKLKGAIVENGFTLGTLAAKVGLNRSTIYRKTQKGGLTYTVGEIHKIAKALQLTPEDISAIFFKK